MAAEVGTSQAPPSPYVPLLLLVILLFMIGIPSWEDSSEEILGAFGSLSTWTVILPIVLVLVVTLLHDPKKEVVDSHPSPHSLAFAGGYTSDGPRWGAIIMFVIFVMLLHLCKKQDE